MKAAEEAAFARGVSAEDLMETAARGIARAILAFFPNPGHLLLVVGKGHNAGDVLAAARLLAPLGWTWELDAAFPEADLAPLTARQLAALRATRPSAPPGLLPAPLVALDGLLGIGAQGEPRAPIAAAIARLHAHRARGAFVVAADLPSGLDADTGRATAACVTADLTVTIGYAKAGLVADLAANHVGRLALVPLPEVTAPGGDPAELLTPAALLPLVPPRPFESHKGIWGRIGIIAGSRGYTGAARLCATGVLRAGGGLITLYATPDHYATLAATVPPEIMVRPVDSYADVLREPHDALAIGPGLGPDPSPAVLELLLRFPGPAVIDADALNLLSRQPAFPAMAGPRLLTPHPGEMARLWPQERPATRRATAEEFAARHGVTLLLKGSRTVIATPGHPTAFNSTGHPGMGTGGMGDVLTGVCAALLARGIDPHDAAGLGAWLCGRAAERAIFGRGGSPESLAASDVLARLGAAFGDLRADRGA